MLSICICMLIFVRVQQQQQQQVNQRRRRFSSASHAEHLQLVYWYISTVLYPDVLQETDWDVQKPTPVQHLHDTWCRLVKVKLPPGPVWGRIRRPSPPEQTPTHEVCGISVSEVHTSPSGVTKVRILDTFCSWHGYSGTSAQGHTHAHHAPITSTLSWSTSTRQRVQLTRLTSKHLPWEHHHHHQRGIAAQAIARDLRWLTPTTALAITESITRGATSFTLGHQHCKGRYLHIQRFA